MRWRDSLKILLSSGSGKAGLLFLGALVVVSLYVVATYPRDFGLRLWNNPAVWADNPKNAPPAWTFLFGGRGTRHKEVIATEPSSLLPYPAGQERLYTFTFQRRADSPPTFLSFTVSNVQYSDTPPVLQVYLTRPDGHQLLLYTHAVRGPRPGESAPYARYTDTPFRVHLSSDDGLLTATANFLQQTFDVAAAPQELQGKAEAALFGVPETDNDLTFTPLAGAYTITVDAFVQGATDSIGKVKLVLGGSRYGLMGTDALGRDLSRGLLFGFPVALLIGLTTAVLSTIIGAGLGIISGFSGGKTDTAIQRLADVLANIPLLPILIFLIFILGQKLWLVVLILVAFGWPGLTILTRSMVLQLRSGQLVEATQALGASRWRIMFRHIAFQIFPFILAQMIFFTPAAILAEAGLSFLGLGDPSIPTWGQILESGFRTGAVYLGYWWWVLPPGILIVITALTFVFITLGLEPVVNPRLRAIR